jgi:hypothetical protein
MGYAFYEKKEEVMAHFCHAPQQSSDIWFKTSSKAQSYY